MNIRLFIAALVSTASLQSQPAWDDTLDFDEIERRLSTEAIVEKKDLRSFLKKSGKKPSGSHPIRIVSLESGLKAVLKKHGGAYGETMAYRMAKTLGLRLLPPTVLREVNGKIVSLQFFVESPIDLMKMTPGKLFGKLDRKDRADKDFLYYLLCQWDTHRGNQIISKHKGRFYIALIDNAGILSISHKSSPKSRIIYGSTLAALKELNREKLEAIWTEYTRERHSAIIIDRILARREVILQLVESGKMRVV